MTGRGEEIFNQLFPEQQRGAFDKERGFVAVYNYFGRPIVHSVNIFLQLFAHTRIKHISVGINDNDIGKYYRIRTANKTGKFVCD